MVSPVKPLFRLQNYSCLKPKEDYFVIANAKLTLKLLTDDKGHLVFLLNKGNAIVSVLDVVSDKQVSAAFTQFELASSLYDFVLTRQKSGISLGLFPERTDTLDSLVCHEVWKICDLQNQLHHHFYSLRDLYTYDLPLLREIRQQMLELYAGDSLYR